MTHLVVDPHSYLKPHHSVGHCPRQCCDDRLKPGKFSPGSTRPPWRDTACAKAGRVGNCWDDSVVESFFSTLKRQLVHRRRFATRDQARREIFAWMGRYNTQHLHSSLDYATPTEWEAHHRTAHQLEQAA